MKIEISDTVEEFSFAPESIEQEISQNIRLLLTADKYSIPLAREMGMKRDYLHRPQQVAEMLMVQDIYDLVEQYEPRAKITNIETVGGNEDGSLKILLEVEVDESELA